ncbi:MAG: hypothetical protein RIR26_443, partial [Pseudomonadota bacterium]
QDFSLNEELGTFVRQELGKDMKIMSHLDKDSVVFATLSGKSVVFDLVKRNFSLVKARPSDMGNDDWAVALGENQYWALLGGKLHYRNTVGNESAEISDTLENILGIGAPVLKPVAVSATSFIGVTGSSLLWLSTQPQLRRELFLQLDSASLGNHSVSEITGGGVIANRGLWLQVKDYIIYIIQDSSGRYYTEKGRLPVLKGPQGALVNPMLTAIFTSNENRVIAPQGQWVVSSGERVFTGGPKGSSPTSSVDNGGKNSVETNPSPTPTATASPTPTGPTLAELQTQYTNKFKATFDSSCVQCHSSRSSRWNSFDAVKLYASQGESRVRSGDMPRGSTLSQTVKTETADFLKALANLP